MKAHSLLFVLFLWFFAVTGVASGALSDSLFACYPLDSNATDLVSGLTGTVNGGTYFNATHYAVGSGSVKFSADGDFINDTRIDVSSLLSSNFTLSFWVSKDNLNQWDRFITLYKDGANYVQIVTGQKTINVVGKYADASGDSSEYGWYHTANLWQDDGSWIHYVVRIYPSVPRVEIWVDGANQSLTSISGFGIGTYTGITLGIRNDYTQSQYFDFLDELKIWSRELTDSEIASEYNSGSGTTCESLTSSGGSPPPSSSNSSGGQLILNMTFDDGFVDHALNRTFTVNGAASTTNSSICKWYGCGNFSDTSGDDYLNSTLQSSMRNGFAASMWVRFNDAPKDSGSYSSYMFSMGGPDSTDRFYLGSTYWGHSTLIPAQNGLISTADGSSYADDADRWHHLFWQYNGSQLTIWKDGQVTLNSTYDYGPVNTSFSEMIYVGKIAPNGASNLRGYLDELLVWNRSNFTTHDVQTIYNEKKDGTPPDLDLYLANFTYTLPINWSSPNNTLILQDMQINLTIRNAGVQNSSSFNYEFVLSGSTVCSGTVSSLNVQSSTTISCTWTPSYGFHVGQVKIDTANTVSEDDESNNNITVYVPFLNRPFLLFNLSDLPEMRDHCNNVTGTLTSLEKQVCDWVKSYSSVGDFSDSYSCNAVGSYGKNGRMMAVGCALNDYGNINPSTSSVQCSKAKNHLKGWANRSLSGCTDVQSLHAFANVIIDYDVMFPNLTQSENEEIVKGLYEKCQYFARELVQPHLDDPTTVDGNNGWGFGSGFGMLCYGLIGAYSKNPSVLLERDDTYNRENLIEHYFRRERSFLYSWKNQSWAQYQEGRSYLAYAMPHLAENLYFESRFNLNNYSLFTNTYCAITREIISTFLDDKYSGASLMSADDYNMRFIQRGDSESYRDIDDYIYPDWAWPTMTASLCPDTVTKQAYAWVRNRAYENGDDSARPYPTLYVFQPFFSSINNTMKHPDSVMPRVIFDNANDIFTVRTNYTYQNDTVLYIDGGEERGGGHSQAQGYYLYALGEPFIDYEQVPYNDDVRAEYWKNGISLQNTTQKQEGQGGVWTSTCGEAPINQYWGSRTNNAAQDCNSSLSDWPDFRRFPLKYGGDLENYFGSSDGSIAGVYVWRPYYLADPVQEYFVKVGNAVFKRSTVKNNYQGDGVYHNFISLARLFNYTTSGLNLTQERNGKYMLTSLLWANTTFTLGGGETNLTACLSKTSCSGSTATNTNYTRYYYYTSDDNADFIIAHHWYTSSPAPISVSVSSGGDEVMNYQNYSVAFDTDNDGTSELSGASSDGWALVHDSSTNEYASFNFTNITEGGLTLLSANDTVSGYIRSSSDRIRIRINPVRRSIGIDKPYPVRLSVYVGGLTNNSNYTVRDENGNILSSNKTGDYLSFDAPASTSDSLSGVTYTVTAEAYESTPVYSLTIVPQDFRDWIIADAYTSSDASSKDTNFGTETGLGVRQPDAGNAELRSYLSLNLTNIPFTTNNSIVLSLYRYSYSPNPPTSNANYYMYLCVDSDGFNETGITWNNQDAQVTNCTYLSHDTSITVGWEYYNLSQAVQGVQVVKLAPNRTLYTLDGEWFYSRESTTNPPQLNISYYGNFTIFTKNINGTYLTNFTASINGKNYSTTTGVLVTDLYAGETINITIHSDRHFSRTFLNQNTNTSKIYTLNQTILNLTVLNGVTGEAISSFTVNSKFGNTSGSNGNAVLYLDEGAHNITISAEGFTDYHLQYTAEPLRVDNLTINMTNNITVNLYEETTGEHFNMTPTSEVKLTIYCSDHTLTHIFTSNSENVELDCMPDLMKLDVTYNSSSTYYRTLLLSGTTTQVDWYLIDLTDEIAYQTIFLLNDLTGDYSNATFEVLRDVNGTTKTIIRQQFDVENKATTYLIRNARYTLRITDNHGNSRIIGYYVADSATEKTITVPQIDLIPTSSAGGASWTWTSSDLESSSTSYIRLYYNDTKGETVNITFTVYNASNTSQILYQVTESNPTSTVFTFLTDNTTQYIVCFNGTHTTYTDIHDCMGYSGVITVGNFTAYTGSEADQQTISNVKKWSIIIMVVIVALAVGAYSPAAAGFMISVFVWVGIRWDWLDLGSSYKNYAFLSIVVMITFFTLWLEAEK